MSKVYWITGLSGSGKTTISKALLEEINKTTEKVIFLDGDDMREHIAFDLGYDINDRKKCGLRYSGLCKMLSKQGFVVICATISMFDEVRDWNRENIDDYVEVYIKVSEETLIKRNQKGMYSVKTPNLMGVNIEPEYPKQPDVILENDQGDIDEFIQRIFKFKEN